ncbi:MAG: ferrous iron transport protein A [Chitinispirillaceae bacterium]
MTRKVSEPKPLTLFKEGDTVGIDSVRGEGPLKKRMLEMGFIPGTILQIIKYAPLYDPIEVKMKHTSISLRITEAREVYVVPVKICQSNKVSLKEVKA